MYFGRSRKRKPMSGSGFQMLSYVLLIGVIGYMMFAGG